MLMHSARNFALQERAIDGCDENLKRLQSLCANLNSQHDSILRSSQQMEEVKEQVRAMQR